MPEDQSTSNFDLSSGEARWTRRTQGRLPQQRPKGLSELQQSFSLETNPLDLDPVPFKVDHGTTPVRIEPEIFEGGGTESEVWEFQSGGSPYVYKVLKDTAPNYDPTDLEAYATQKKHEYNVFKEYLGDYLATTYFIIAKDNNGQKKLVRVQPKFIGETMGTTLGRKDWSPEVDVEIDKVVNLAKQAYQDERLEKLRNEEPVPEILTKSNILVSPTSGEVRVIDW